MARIVPSTGERVEIAPRRSFTPKQRLQVLLNGNGRCHICREKIIDVFEIEHPIAHALGGSDDIADLRPAHPDCHARKTREQDVPQVAKAKRQSKLRLDEPRTVSATPIRSRGFEKPRRRLAKTSRNAALSSRVATTSGKGPGIDQ